MLQAWYKYSLYSIYPRLPVISSVLSFALSVSFFKSFERNHWEIGTCQGHPVVKSVSDATTGIAEHWWWGRAPEVKFPYSLKHMFVNHVESLVQVLEIMTNYKSI